MPLSLICSVSSLTLENYKIYFMHIQDNVISFFGDRLSVLWSVTPSQIEVHALCNCIGTASYFLSRDFQTGHPPPHPYFLVYILKFAARCVEGGQPAAVRGQGCEESTDKGLGSQDPLYPRGNLPTKKINNFMKIIITDSTSRTHTRHYSSSEFPFTLMAELKWHFTDAYTI